MAGEWCSAGDQGLFFIIGMPRSGTKLLRELLNQHPRICIPTVETEFYPYLDAYLRKHGPCTSLTQFRRLYARLSALPFFTYLSEAGKSIDPEKWYRACGGYTAPHIFHALLKLVTGSEDDPAMLLGDKSPSYINQLDLLAAAFPSARYIHIVRDPRDYCLSINQAWGKNITRAAARWSESVRGVIARSDDLSMHELRYEDLVENVESEIRSICEFLGVEFVPSMLQPGKSVENLGDARGHVGVMRSNSGKYRDRMKDSTRLNVEKLVCEELRHFGYELEWRGPTRRLGRASAVILQCVDAINLVRFERKKRGIVGSIRFYWNYYRATRAI